MPLVWSQPAGALGGMTAPRIKRGQYVLGCVIGGEADDSVPLMSEGWRAMKAQFEPSERAQNTRE